MNSEKIKRGYKILSKEYGSQGWWPIIDTKSSLSVYDKRFPKRERSSEEKFEICIGAILTQNTSWQNVEKALINLKKNNLLSLSKLEKTDTKKIARLIKPSGYYNQKAKKVKELVKFLKSGKDISRENLLSVWGVGPETADSILLYAYNKPVFVIDAYTKRIMNRLGFGQEDYGALQELFMKNLPKDAVLYNEYHALMVRLAKDFCRTVPVCECCHLRTICKCNY
ncbi:hypothetical protein FJZ53_02300 [Candidatus Woesearchaeota archaeon]|nr:hypothetical protein [Candidatus Woesearchaeota archaeon]